MVVFPCKFLLLKDSNNNLNNIIATIAYNPYVILRNKIFVKYITLEVLYVFLSGLM